MATSGTTVFSNTARDLIKAALQEIGTHAINEDPTSSELEACILRFNGMLKTWQSRGVLWKHETIDQAIIADTATTTLPEDVRSVNSARYVDSPTNERQMVRFERDEYMRLPNKSASGTSTVFYIERNSSNITISLWPVPRTNATLKLDADMAMDTITDGTETVDVPEEWAETLYSNLAVRIAGIFGAELRPDLVVKAQTSERELFDNYRPASYMLGPEYA